jgi:hypothetical protein
MTFSLGDTVRSPAGLETTKRLEVNGETVWERSGLDDRFGLYRVDVGSRLRPGAENLVRWVFGNGFARQEELRLYFVDDFWREAAWTSDDSHGSHWTASYVADSTGDLGPLAPSLDIPFFSLYRMDSEALDYARRWPGGFSFYAPYITTQPVIVNNRFLYGLYASALGAKSALVYAYADWGPQPWDDDAQSEVYRMGGGSHAIRGSAGYAMILPSWGNKVYDTVVYESLREGIEDSRIIATLKKAIARHPGPQAQAAQTFLESVLAKPSREVHPRYWGTDASLPIDRYADRSAEILSDLADGDPNAYGVFDEFRRRMIEYIVQLSAMPPDQATSAPASPPGG